MVVVVVTVVVILVVLVVAFVVVVGAVVVLPVEPPHRLTPFRVIEVMLGGGMLPPLKVTWKPLVKVSPAAQLVFQGGLGNE